MHANTGDTSLGLPALPMIDSHEQTFLVAGGRADLGIRNGAIFGAIVFAIYAAWYGVYALLLEPMLRIHLLPAGRGLPAEMQMIPAVGVPLALCAGAVFVLAGRRRA